MAAVDYYRMHQRVQTFCLLALTLVAVGGALYYLRPVLMPFVLAVLLTYCLTPLIDLQIRYLRMPWLLAMGFALCLGLVIVGLCGAIVATSVSGASDKLADYNTRFQELTKQFARSVPLSRLGLQVDAESVGRYFSVQEGSGWQLISGVIGELANLISDAAMVVIFTIFMLLGRKQQQQRRAPGVLAQIEAGVKRYILETVMFSAAVGVLVGLTLTALGVEFAWVFALLTFLLNFIPNIGPMIAALLPLPVLLLSPEMSLAAKLLALAIPAAIHFVVGNFVQPKVQGSSLDVHPIAVLLALIFFGMIWGVIGAFLATPIAGVIRIILGNIPITRPLGELLAGNLEGVAAEGAEMGEPPASTNQRI